MTARTQYSRGLVGRLPQPEGSRPALIVVPPGSAGPEAAVGWLDHLRGADVAIVQLPGRGQRLFEKPVNDISEFAATLADELTAVLPAVFVVLGHCSGALLGLELAHRLHAAGHSPQRLFISSSRSPAEPADPNSDYARAAAETAAMTDRQLFEELAARGHLPGTQIDPEIVAAILGAHRAAVRAAAGYRCALPPLAVPTEVWRGEKDDVVNERHARDWQGFVAHPLSVIEFEGSRAHFEEPMAAALARVRSALTSDYRHPDQKASAKP